MNVEQAREVEAAAKAEFGRLERERDAEITAATNEIVARHAPALAKAREALSAARLARIQAEDAAAAHPWEGKRVWRMENTGSWRNPKTARVEGIVDVFRSDSAYPANMPSWRLPSIGTAIVRPLKKDGTPSAKFTSLDRGTPWKLVDESQSNG